MKTNELVGNIAVLQNMLNGATQEQWIALRAAMDALLQVKAFEDAEQSKWIRLEDKKPSGVGIYLITTSEGRIGTGLYFSDEEGFLDDVIAWQPLPEAYHKLP